MQGIIFIARKPTQPPFEKGRSSFQIKIILESLLEVLLIAPVNQFVIYSAFALEKYSDLEDAIQYASAEYENCDFLITRNTKDFFEEGNTKIITPSEFLSL